MIKKVFTANQIESTESNYLYVGDSKLPNAGNGLFTAMMIYKDEIIALYKGEVLSKQETIKRGNENQGQYFIELLNGKILDCNKVDGFAKFANDTQGSADSIFSNNAKIVLNEKNEVCLTATRKIKAGEEIFCSYGKRYWLLHGKR